MKISSLLPANLVVSEFKFKCVELLVEGSFWIDGDRLIDGKKRGFYAKAWTDSLK